MTALKVLIADDDRVLTHALSTGLRAKGWTVQVAYDAMQAVMYAMRTPPDAIVLDVRMPGGTGIAALKQLKASTKTEHIPVLVLSGSIDPAEGDGLRALGAAAFVAKPVEAAALHDMLVKLVG
jgi:twitching motility two-component system response regulator PilH